MYISVRSLCCTPETNIYNVASQSYFNKNEKEKEIIKEILCVRLCPNYLNCIVWFLLESLGIVVMIICILLSTAHTDNKSVSLG